MSFSSTNNNPFDFVSADVNEVLQEAPQILTNLEQPRDGQHSNELDESTTVEVTKQDSDEDPMEVTVLRKKLVELAKDEDKPPAREEDQTCISKKNRDEGNALDSELESLSREDLVNLVRILLVDEAQKQLVETTKQDTEESAKQAEIVQLEREKAGLHDELGKKMAEIVEMHKELDEKSQELVKKADQINALLVQLNESTSDQHQLPTEQEMKIQLSLETWYDWLGFVPRHRLGQIVPMIGDRRFGSIVQKFLHEYGEISIFQMETVAPYEEDPNGSRPRVRAFQNRSPLRFEMAEAQMPANIKNFNTFELSYCDQSVLDFLQKFQQNGLLENVNLIVAKLLANDIVQPVLCHLLPLINGILSITVEDSAQLVHFYDAENSKEIYELNMKMMEKTRCLGVRYDAKNLHTNQIDLYCRWLYQTAHADGKPRMLLLKRLNVDPAPISLFIDRLIQDFLMATNPVTFLIRIILPKAFQHIDIEDICLDNGNTKERFQTKMDKSNPKLEMKNLRLHISRYPLASEEKWIMGKEICQKRIYLTKELKLVAI